MKMNEFFSIRDITTLASVAIAFYVAYRSGRREQLAEEEKKREKLRQEFERETDINVLKTNVANLHSKVEEIETNMHKGFADLSTAYASIANEMRKFFRGEYPTK